MEAVMPKMNDLTGLRFGRWTVVEFADKAGQNARWLCRCDCGTDRIVQGTNLGRGSTSCGCLQRETIGNMRRKHGRSSERLYLIWWRMIDRCENVENRDYKNYGMRGIRVCKRWHKFENFTADMDAGYEKGLTLEREDVNGHYEPSNCRWATQFEQTCNTRRSVIIDTPWGRMNACHAADKLGIQRSVFLARVHRKWPPEKLFSPSRYTPKGEVR